LREKVLRQILVNNWFYPVAAMLLLTVWASYRLPALPPIGHQSSLTEAALIFDAFVSLPLLYWLCFHRRKTLRANIVGMVAVACCGLWLAGWIVPSEAQMLLPQLSWLRPVVLAGLAAIELRLLIGVLKILFKAGTGAKEIQELGAPPLAARLMLIEARFWRWVFSKLRK
jgi:hypothetical protein